MTETSIILQKRDLTAAMCAICGLSGHYDKNIMPNIQVCDLHIFAPLFGSPAGFTNNIIFPAYRLLFAGRMSPAKLGLNFDQMGCKEEKNYHEKPLIPAETILMLAA